LSGTQLKEGLDKEKFYPYIDGAEKHRPTNKKEGGEEGALKKKRHRECNWKKGGLHDSL